MAHLAQAYIHLKPYSAPDKKLKSLGRYAERLARRRAAQIYGSGVIVEIELEEGSLVTRITIIGSLLLAASGHIADYKGFKESVVEMCDDAREFAVDVCAPFVKKAGVPEEDVYRFERRLKTPGKLYRLSKRLQRLESGAADLSARQVQRELAQLRAELDGIAGDLSQQEMQALEKGLKTKRLPPPQKWPVNPEPPKQAVLKPDEQASLFDDETDHEDHSLKRRVVFHARSKVTEDPKRDRTTTRVEQHRLGS